MLSALHTLHKSKTISMIALDRVGDYLDLLKVEMKIRENELLLRIAAYAVAGVFGLLATVFLGLAIIVSF
ncbi:MAG: phage holin family protein, partial [Burkholderia sp.]|nr:phage holin family protein [Burkholderia sp.]